MMVPILKQGHVLIATIMAALSDEDMRQFREALLDNVQTPVPDQVSFRCDFPAYLETLSERDGNIALDLMTGERTSDVARKHEVSPARISQLRRRFHDGWQAYCGTEV